MLGKVLVAVALIERSEPYALSTQSAKDCEVFNIRQDSRTPKKLGHFARAELG